MKILKSIFYWIWPLIYPVFSKNKFARTLNQKVSMKQLWKTDPAKWRVEMARQMGAIVGENCRFYSLNIFSEPYLMEFGDNVIVSGEVIFVTHDGGIYLFSDEESDLLGHYGKIKIGSNCFIGMGAIILPDVEIGNNCIVGAGAVVMDSFPDDTVIIGNPAHAAFKLSIYKRMRLSSKKTIRNKDYAYPRQGKMPVDLKREIVLKQLASLPMRKAKQKLKG